MGVGSAGVRGADDPGCADREAVADGVGRVEGAGCVVPVADAERVVGAGGVGGVEGAGCVAAVGGAEGVGGAGWITGVGKTHTSGSGAKSAKLAAVFGDGAMAADMRANMARARTSRRSWRRLPGRVSSRKSRGDQPKRRARAHHAAPIGISTNTSA
jgi:hypothetical protein